jgi:hypothetical protein
MKVFMIMLILLVEGYQGVAEKIFKYKDMPIRTLDTVADGVAYLKRFI